MSRRQQAREDVMSETTVSRRVNSAGVVVLWVVQLLLAVPFVSAGVMKLTGSDAMVDMFAEIGIGQWFRYTVGILELVGAIGLPVPRLCGLAALGLVGVMAGAIVTNMLVLEESPVSPLVLLVLAGAVAWFRRSTIRDLAAQATQR